MTKLPKNIFVAFTTLLFIMKAAAREGSMQLLDSRAAYYGGFSLNVANNDCPAGTFSCIYSGISDSEQFGPCCPFHTVCSVGSGYCCPTSEDCNEAVQNTPTCADPSWTLFAGAGAGDYMCCPAGWEIDEGEICFQPGATSDTIDPGWQSTAQANNAAPTGDGQTIAITGASAAATSAAAGGAGSAPTNNPGTSAAAPGTGSPTAAPGTGSPTTAGSPSATKKSAAGRTSMIGGSALALADVLVVVSLLL